MIPNFFKMAPDGVWLIYKRHYEVVRRNVVEIAGMNQDTFAFEKGGCNLFLVSRDTKRDVEPAPRGRERKSSQALDSCLAASRNPLFVLFEELFPLDEQVWNSELGDLVYR